MHKAFEMGLQFNDTWFVEEPYNSLKTEPKFEYLINKYNPKLLRD